MAKTRILSLVSVLYTDVKNAASYLRHKMHRSDRDLSRLDSC